MPTCVGCKERNPMLISFLSVWQYHDAGIEAKQSVRILKIPSSPGARPLDSSDRQLHTARGTLLRRVATSPSPANLEVSSRAFTPQPVSRADLILSRTRATPRPSARCPSDSIPSSLRRNLIPAQRRVAINHMCFPVNFLPLLLKETSAHQLFHPASA